MKKYSEEKIIKSLNHTMNEITPDVFDSIEASLKGKDLEMKKKFKWQWIPIVMVTAIILVFGGLYYNNNYVVDSLIGIDVNPSIELEINKSNKVIKVNTLNDGARKIVDGMDLTKVDLNVALNALVGSMVKYGYLTGEDANILISVQNDSETKVVEVKKLVTDIIDKSLSGTAVSPTVINQTITKSDTTVEKSASENHISYGKALFISELVKKDSTLNEKELSTMSLREIAALVESKKIDISDIVELDEDDSTVELIDDAIEDLNEEKEITNDTSKYIGKEAAKVAAYKHAGISSSDVKKVVVKLDSDDGVANYDVEFRTETKKYEYEINATNGNVLDFETETIRTTSITSTTYIGEAKAKSIACTHAGVSESEIALLKIVVDNDNGQKVYDIEFSANGYEYNYEINAVNGNIMDFEKEIDD